MFIALSRRESLSEQSRVLDRLYGNQPSKTLAVMKRATASILAPNAGWPLYFKVLVGAPLPEHKVNKKGKKEKKKKICLNGSFSG